MSKTVLVTGATSRVGIALIKELADKGYSVRALVKNRLSERISELPKSTSIYFADISSDYNEDIQSIKEASAGVDVIIHLAAAVYNYRYNRDEFLDINVIGTQRLIDAFIESNKVFNKTLHFLLSSTVSVYGYKRADLLTENSPLKPSSNYAVSKYMAENVVKSYAEAYSNIKYTIFRYATFFGDGYNDHIYKVFDLVRNKTIRIIGDGNNVLNFVHYMDSIKAIMLSLENDNALNKVYNITDGESYKQKDLIELAAKLLNVDLKPKHVSHMIARIVSVYKESITRDELDFIASNRRISIDRAIQDLNYKPDHILYNEAKDIVNDYLTKRR
ncbi:MAG: dTDP-4-dehydrorhamnose 3,5-epimerase [Candidatus Micrarchaeota archaeon]|nr:MAG: dTDP-4-dehydrorhamnose 3,5-epimerase [Candidatus Micrarchaeota archaeon]